MKRLRYREPLLRARKPHEHSRVTYVELFFDLVFVFAVTQLSHALLEHLTLGGAIETLMLFMAVWWVWIYTSWITNWLDPERTPVRLMLFALMLAGLMLSTSIPEAFAETGHVFAGAYVFMQLGRSLFMLWALRDDDPANTRNFQRIGCWFVLSGLFWVGGGQADEPLRLALWVVALALDYVAPSLGFPVPGLGRSATADWNVEGGHMAERCALFIIIAFGESILVTGATFGELDWAFGTVGAFLAAFLGSIAMWWIYFDTAAERGSLHISRSEDPGRVARLAYTYMHLPIVGGIIVSAVADELVLAHPTGEAGAASIAAIIGGPALYLLGNLLFKRVIAGRVPLSHLVGLALLALLVPAAPLLSPLALAGVTTLALIVVATWETISLRGGRRRLGAAP